MQRRRRCKKPWNRDLVRTDGTNNKKASLNESCRLKITPEDRVTYYMEDEQKG
jgi:hypothetical protein